MDNVITFGTDGFRAVIGENFTFENVKCIAQAIALYLKDKNNDFSKPILIGYDTRFMAEKFASFCADVLADNGLNVLLSNSFLPTPVLAFAAKEMNTQGAIMFTASHNPPEYLGMKFIPEYAGPATSDITDKILQNLNKPIKDSSKGKVELFCPKNIYFNHIEKIINFEKLIKLNKNICFDALFGTSQGYFDEILENHSINLKKIHCYRDALFGGNMPEPKEKYLSELKEFVKNTDSCVGFSNDGDADRFAVIDENGEFVTPNEIMAILLIHLIKNKKMTGNLVKTVAGSMMLDIIAKKLNIDVIETAVGFKHVGQAMRENNVILGGEESGGLSIKGHIPEKDGILANLLILEAIAYSNKTLAELRKDLKLLCNTNFINKRFDLKLDEKTISGAKDKLLNYSDRMICDKKIINISKKDGIKFYLENAWILIRFSGTEPLLRIYFEAEDENFINKGFETIKAML